MLVVVIVCFILENVLLGFGVIFVVAIWIAPLETSKNDFLMLTYHTNSPPASWGMMFPFANFAIDIWC